MLLILPKKTCAYKCSTHCDGDDCNILKGNCLTGCKDEYIGEKWDCLYGNFSLNINYLLLFELLKF